MKAQVMVTLKQGVLDPQGQAIEGALRSLGYEAFKDVRQGKFFELTIQGLSKSEAEKKIGEICQKLLSNTVIENYRFEILD